VPKRVVDGEAIATSFKIRRIQEEWRIHYPYLLTLALANGTFECDPEVIWAKRYAIFMPSMTKEHVAEMIRAFEAADLLRTWRDKEGRLCGWWVGINKPGRLPPKSRLKRHEEALGPELPRAVLSQPTCNLTAGHQVECVGPVQDGAQETPTEHVRNTSAGLGLGLGLGSGTSASKEQKPRSRSSKKQLEPVGFSEFWNVYPKKKAKTKAQEAFQRLSPTPELLNTILKAIHQYNASEDWRKEKGRYIPHPASFLNGRRWEDEIAPSGGNGEAGGSLTQEELVRLTEGKHERQSVPA
jgi:hypothetical protein